MVRKTHTIKFLIMEIGQKVKANIDFCGVPKGTKGLVIHNYGCGVTIAWDLPHKRLPKNMTPKEIALMWEIRPQTPLREGYLKDEYKHLVKI